MTEALDHESVAAHRQVILVGANPAVQLFDGEGLTAFASVWRVDWSPYGRGTAMVLWVDGVVRVIGEPVSLARWLEREFVRFFPEVDGLPWPAPEVAHHAVHVDIDLGSGLEAGAGDVTLRFTDVLDRRTFSTDDFDLGGRQHSLSLVIAPCSAAIVEIGGSRLPGAPQVQQVGGRPAASCFVTEAEVWRR